MVSSSLSLSLARISSFLLFTSFCSPATPRVSNTLISDFLSDFSVTMDLPRVCFPLLHLIPNLLLLFTLPFDHEVSFVKVEFSLQKMQSFEVFHCVFLQLLVLSVFLFQLQSEGFIFFEFRNFVLLVGVGFPLDLVDVDIDLAEKDLV